jgi:S-disulfanyl-L-cysteine oxidoreductase SoxD
MKLPAFVFLILALTQAAAAQESGNHKTVLDGVFTAAQAERGKQAYALHCSSCHMEDLQGPPALKGEQFLDNWREDSVKSLFTFVQTRMPQGAPGSLGVGTYVDIVSYIFSENMFPGGPKELNADELGRIDVVGKGGPAPIPKFALVTLVGCLVGADTEWKLQSASTPRRTREEKPAASEVQASAARPLGSGTFRLVYIDSLRPGFIPERHAGNKLHAQGYLLSNEKGDGLSVTWLEAVASTCTE